MKRWQRPFPRGTYVDDPRIRNFCTKHSFAAAPQIARFDGLTIVMYERSRLYFLRKAWEMLPDDGVLVMKIMPPAGSVRFFCASKVELEAAFGEVRQVEACWNKSPYAYHWRPGSEPPAEEA